MTRAKDISKIITDADFSGTLEITKGASGASANAAADELVLQNSGDAGLSILSPNANNSQILLGSPVANAGGIIRWTGDDNAVKIGTNNTGSTLRFHVGGFSEVMRISSAGNVGIGTASPAFTLEVNKGSAGDIARFTDGVNANTVIKTSGSVTTFGPDTNNSLALQTNNAERMRISSAGRIGLGTASADAELHIEPVSGATNASILLSNNGRTQYFRIQNNETNDALTFNSNDTNERMRIVSSGNVLVGTTNQSPAEGTTVGIRLGGNGTSQFSSSGDAGLSVNRTSDNGNVMTFRRDGNLRGRIAVDGSSTSYITSSDYRLKENIVDMTNATAKLKQLKPKRFNFISDADKTVDGFLAHEVQTVVPEAIDGEKDATNEDGSILAQGIDQSKLVPLLVKTIQELEARITALETA